MTLEPFAKAQITWEKSPIIAEHVGTHAPLLQLTGTRKRNCSDEVLEFANRNQPQANLILWQS